MRNRHFPRNLMQFLYFARPSSGARNSTRKKEKVPNIVKRSLRPNFSLFYRLPLWFSLFFSPHKCRRTDSLSVFDSFFEHLANKESLHYYHLFMNEFSNVSSNWIWADSQLKSRPLTYSLHHFSLLYFWTVPKVNSEVNSWRFITNFSLLLNLFFVLCLLRFLIVFF